MSFVRRCFEVAKKMATERGRIELRCWLSASSALLNRSLAVDDTQSLEQVQCLIELVI